MSFIRYNVRSLWVRKVTTGITIAGVALVTLVFAAALMLADGVTKTVTAGGSDNIAVAVRSGATSEMESAVDESAIGMVLSQPGLAQDNGAPIGGGEVVVVIAINKIGDPGMSNVIVRGYGPGSLKTRPALKIVEGRFPTPGTDEAMVGSRIEGRFEGRAIGSTVEARKNRPLRIVGVFEAGGSSVESEVWADVDVIRSTFGREGGVSAIRVQLASPAELERFAATVESDKRLGLDVKG